MSAKIIKRVVQLDGPVIPEQLPGYLFTEENRGHTFLLLAYQGGQAQALAGSITATFLNANDETVPLDGVIVDGAAAVTLDAGCYQVEGRFLLTVYCGEGSDACAIYAAEGKVKMSAGNTAYDPSQRIPSLTELRQEVAALRTATGEAQAVVTANEDRMSALTDVTGLRLPAWESGGMYSATGIEYASSAHIRTGFIPVTPGDTYRFDWAIQKPFNIYGFASDTQTQSGVNQRIAYKATPYASQPLIYTIPENVNFIRCQIEGTLSDEKPIMTSLGTSMLHTYTMEQAAAQTRQIIGTDGIATKTAAAAAIPEGADLDDYTVPGNYYPATTAIAGSLNNLPYSPFGVKFRLMVMELAGTGNPVQLMITEAAVPRIFKRYCAAGTWRAWTELATMDSVMAATAEIIDADITGSNKADYFADADDAPVNTVYSVSSTAEMANTPLGPGVASNGNTSYTDLRSIAGYQSGVLYTYKSGVMINQLFVSTTKGSGNASGDPTVLWYRSKWQYGSWSDWHAAGDRVALSASNIIIVNKMIAHYKVDGVYTNTLPDGAEAGDYPNGQYMGDDPRIFNDFNNAPINKMYQIDLNCTSELMANNPMPGKSSVLCTFGFGYASTHGRFQLCVGLNYPNVFAFIRYGYYQDRDTGFVWTPWASLTGSTPQETFGIKTRLDNGTDLDTVKASGVYLLGTNGGYINAPTGLTYGFLTVKTINVITCQTVETPGGNFARFYDGSAWGAWR